MRSVLPLKHLQLISKDDSEKSEKEMRMDEDVCMIVQTIRGAMEDLTLVQRTWAAWAMAIEEEKRREKESWEEERTKEREDGKAKHTLLETGEEERKSLKRELKKMIGEVQRLKDTTSLKEKNGELGNEEIGGQIRIGEDSRKEVGKGTSELWTAISMLREKVKDMRVALERRRAHEGRIYISRGWEDQRETGTIGVGERRQKVGEEVDMGGGKGGGEPPGLPTPATEGVNKRGSRR